MRGFFYSNKRSRSAVADIAVGSQHFTLAGGNTNKAIHSLLQAQAKVAASAVGALTDNGGGTADGDIEVIGNFTNAVVGTNDAAQKAGLETGFGTVLNALKEVAAYANLLQAKVPALADDLVDSITGTAADQTIAAITVSYSPVGVSMASAAGAKVVMTNIKNRISQLTYHVNLLAVACGQAPVVDAGGGTVSTSLTIADVSTDTGTATDGSDTTDAKAIIKATDADAKLVIVRNAVKELSAKLAACRASATGGVMEVVAA